MLSITTEPKTDLTESSRPKFSGDMGRCAISQLQPLVVT